MKPDTQISNEIQEEFLLHHLSDCKINVVVNEGYVTLFGKVDSYTKKVMAERTAKNVEGVKELFSDIEVIFNESIGKKESKLAKSLLIAAKWRIRN